MKGISDRHLRELMEAYIGRPEGLPEIDYEEQAAFIEDYFDGGAPELRVVFVACNISLRALSLLLKGRSFSRLEREEREDLLNRIMSSRNPLLRGIGVLLGLPLLMSYYRRPEVAVPLGFNSRTLREEADLRVVTRDKDLPPKEGEAS
jgi:hypothetical protein